MVYYGPDTKNGLFVVCGGLILPPVQGFYHALINELLELWAVLNQVHHHFVKLFLFHVCCLPAGMGTSTVIYLKSSQTIVGL